MSDPSARSFVRDGIAVVALALALRLTVAVWAADFTPVDDGAYYHVIAARIARGLGYTWAWPDGTVTYAAHYPVGYPALVGSMYVLFGAKPVFAGILNALIGALGVLAAHRIAARARNRWGALLGASLVALHPGLVLYTPALMTEGVTGALLAIAGYLAVRAREARSATVLLALGALLGVATLARPPSLLLGPALGALAAVGVRGRVRAAAIVTLTALAVVAPWSVRNCQRMGQCVMVSANAGWNLLIGVGDHADGGYVPLDRMSEARRCAFVFDEAGKDSCFAGAGLDILRSNPMRLFSLAPAKLAATFDGAGAPAAYAEQASAGAVGPGAARALAGAELVFNRGLLLAALGAVALAPGPRRRARRALGLCLGAAAVSPWAWPAYLGLAPLVALGGRGVALSPGAVAASIVLATGLVHVAFFGAARYALVCVPVLCALAGTVLTRAARAGDTPSEETAGCP